MPTPLTPQQQAAANAKRRATQAANRAAGVPTVRQQRAAKRAAKAAAAGQTSSTTSQQTTAPPPFGQSAPRGRRRRARFGSGNNPTPQPTTAQPIFAPAPNYRALKLAALVALEQCFGMKVADLKRTAPRDANGVPQLPQDIVDGWETYKKLKAHAVDPKHPAPHEAAAALTVATVRLVKLAF